MRKTWINADKSHLWKDDISASVDQFNQWFMQFAPKAFRSTRLKTTTLVKDALLATRDLSNLDAPTLKANPSALSTLRMCTAPPLAVDRLIGLAHASKNLVSQMEKGKLPAKMSEADLDDELRGLCRILADLLDRDIFPWLGTNKVPAEHERDRASTIVADRLTNALADPEIRNAQERRQLDAIDRLLKDNGYRMEAHPAGKPLTEMTPGTYCFRLNLFTKKGRGRKIKVPVDAAIQTKGL